MAREILEEFLEQTKTWDDDVEFQQVKSLGEQIDFEQANMQAADDIQLFASQFQPAPEQLEVLEIASAELTSGISESWFGSRSIIEHCCGNSCCCIIASPRSPTFSSNLFFSFSLPYLMTQFNKRSNRSSFKAE